MSDLNNKETNKEPKDKAFIIRVIAFCLVGVILVTSVIIYSNKQKREEGGNPPEKTMNGTLTMILDKLIENNGYIEVAIGPEQYIYFVYNKKGEVILESASGTEFKKSNHEVVVVGDEEVKLIKGTDPISELRYANELFNSEINTDNNRTLNIIKVTGDSNIIDLYNKFGDDYGTQMLKLLKDTVDIADTGDTKEPTTSGNEIAEDIPKSDNTEESTEDTTNKGLLDPEQLKEDGIKTNITNELTIEFGVVTNDNGTETFTAYKKIITPKGQEYYDWAVNGYYALGDWELPEEWYGDIKSRNIADVHNDVDKILKKLDINMLSLMGKLKEVIPDLETAELKLIDYFNKDDTEKENLIRKSIADLDKCQYVISCTESELKDGLEELKGDTDFENIELMLGVIYTADKNNWLSVKSIEEQQKDLGVTELPQEVKDKIGQNETKTSTAEQ